MIEGTISVSPYILHCKKVKISLTGRIHIPWKILEGINDRQLHNRECKRGIAKKQRNHFNALIISVGL